jgi:hypothetical protein
MSYTKVYTSRRARAAHLLDAGLYSPNDAYSFALCGRRPNYPDAWFGTGAWHETEYAKALRVCDPCQAAADAAAKQAPAKPRDPLTDPLRDEVNGDIFVTQPARDQGSPQAIHPLHICEINGDDDEWLYPAAPHPNGGRPRLV